MTDTAISRRRFVKVSGAAVGTVVLGGGALKLATAAPEVEKPSSRMGEGAMKALVVYGTKSGCTQGIAEKIGETLAARGVSVDVVPAEKAGDPAAYDAVVVGSGVRAGQWHAAAKEWVKGNAATLKSKKVAFYTCGLTMADGPEKAPEVRAYTDPLISESGITPVDVGLFAGWFVPSKFSFAERTIMKLMKAPQGDRRDFSAVAEWTTSVAPRLGIG